MRKRGHINIATVIFGVIAAYLIFIIIRYATADQVVSYQVTAGTLSRNETCTAMVFRNEEVVNAETDGYVSYLIPDGSKAAEGEAVCVFGSSPEELENNSASDQDLDTIQTYVERYAKAYDRDQFESVYDLKYSLNAAAVDTDGQDSVTGTIQKTTSDGVIAYSADGYEDKKYNEVVPSDFNVNGYQKKLLASDSQIQKGSPVYRLVHGNVWSVVIPLTERQQELLEDRDSIRVRFEKDGNSEVGTIQTFKSGENTYARILFTNGMVRYISDRFLDVELVTNTKSGLKIPNSSIVEKEFFIIPEAYQTTGGENGSTGFMKETEGKNGKKTTSFVEAAVYGTRSTSDDSDGSDASDSEEKECYVEKGELQEGDIIVQPDSSNRFRVGETDTLQGVYNINRGYAVFRKIEVIDQDDESSIVRKNVRYGISQFDFIAKNGDAVREQEIVQ